MTATCLQYYATAKLRLLNHCKAKSGGYKNKDSLLTSVYIEYAQIQRITHSFTNNMGVNIIPLQLRGAKIELGVV